jgi:two-component system cell cycle sensor histidine kinase/response regulator CckA
MERRHPTRILVIEDNPTDREICKRYLQQSGDETFEFAESESLASGIALSQQYRPDCILLDVHLPDGNGVGALTDLRSFPVVVLTAFGDEELAVRAMKAGAMDYLSKGRLADEMLPRTVHNAISQFEMHQRYDAMLEAIPHMVWTAAADGGVEYANQQWFDYTGLSLRDAANLGWDQLLHPEDRARTWRAWEESGRSGSVFEIEHRLRRASDRSYRWHLVRAVPVHASSGEVTHWFGTCTDIEDQKQKESLLLAQEKLKGIGVLAGGVAHDFNNVLTVILGQASLAMSRLDAAHPARQELQAVLQAGERAAQLTQKMLVYAGKGLFRAEIASVDKLVFEALMSMRPTIPPYINLRYRSGRDLPPVRTDVSQLRQVVGDLVKNAVEAIDGNSTGTIWVRTSAVQIGGENGPRDRFLPAGITTGKYVALEVRDTGCGMDVETQKRIFDPFFTTKFAGRGLGLAAVQGFARSHGGAVEVRSAAGKGTRFRVLLPAAASAATSATSKESDIRQAS